MTRIVVTAGARTAITGWHRAQADISAHELAATTFAAMPKDPEMVMLGNTIGPGGNIARIAALAAGWQSAGAITFDAQCGSGLVAVGQAVAQAKMTGHNEGGAGAGSPATDWPAGAR